MHNLESSCVFVCVCLCVCVCVCGGEGVRYLRYLQMKIVNELDEQVEVRSEGKSCS